MINLTLKIMSYSIGVSGPKLTKVDEANPIPPYLESIPRDFALYATPDGPVLVVSDIGRPTWKPDGWEIKTTMNLTGKNFFIYPDPPKLDNDTLLRELKIALEERCGVEKETIERHRAFKRK